jgi:hypothetical protein
MFQIYFLPYPPKMLDFYHHLLYNQVMSKTIFPSCFFAKNQMVQCVNTFIFLLFFSQLPAQVSEAEIVKTLLMENPDIEVYITCRATASIDQSDWLRFVIKNRSSHPLFIHDADCFLNEEITPARGKKYIDRGYYGSENKYFLLHCFFDKSNPSDRREGVEIPPFAELASWKYLVNYASALIEGRRKSGALCP